MNPVAAPAPTPDALLQLGMGFFGSKARLSAIVLTLFTQLARELGTCEELPLFEALYAEPARLRQFLGAMTGVSRGANLAIATDFPWSKYRTFADIGTAQGDLAVQVARAHRHLIGSPLSRASSSISPCRRQMSL